MNNTIIDHLGFLHSESNKLILKLLRVILLVGIGISLLTIASKINIPFYPIPMTLQTMFVLLIGLTYGPKLATLTIISYLALGVYGIPVFAGTPEKGIGIAYMSGPTGGFLFGFVFSAWVMGKFAVYKFDRGYLRALIAMFTGEFIIFGCGLIYLGILLGFDKPIFTWGLIPFIPAEIFKIVIVTLLLPTIWRRIDSKK